MGGGAGGGSVGTILTSEGRQITHNFPKKYQDNKQFNTQD